ncbi:MAG: 50S ribosomal protein L18 [Candidatus Magasanikbacteria bacterium]|nr:50S ribosomal protein L18 [Candidatus Magasanikbacteria bacterium]
MMRQNIPARQRRRGRVRSRVQGTAACPRLNISRSLRSMFAQLVDDEQGRTLASVHSKRVSNVGDVGERAGKVAVSYLLGRALAERAKAAGITRVVFDRAGYKYHGRVRAVADGARDGGLQF